MAAETEEELKELIQQLKDGDTFVPKAAAAAKADHEGDLPMEEDSLDYSGILRDTRPSNVPSNITSNVASNVTSARWVMFEFGANFHVSFVWHIWTEVPGFSCRNQLAAANSSQS